MNSTIDPDKPVFEDPAKPRLGRFSNIAITPSRSFDLWRQDFYGQPAWAFWALCTAAGVIAAVVYSGRV